MATAGSEWLVWKDLSRRSATDPVWAVKPRLRARPAARDRGLPPGARSRPACRRPASCGASSDAAHRPVAGCSSSGSRASRCGSTGSSRSWCAGGALGWPELHARFAAKWRRSPCGRLLALGRDYFRRWIERLERSGRWLAATMREVDGLVRSSRARRPLAGRPAGHPGPRRVLPLERPRRGVATSALRIRPVDWEMAGIGAGLLDLAALTSGSWSETERTTIVEAYRRALPERLRPLASDLRAGLDSLPAAARGPVADLVALSGRRPPITRTTGSASALGLASRLERPTPPSAHATPSGGLAS
jgi:hypothetical protein